MWRGITLNHTDCFSKSFSRATSGFRCHATTFCFKESTRRSVSCLLVAWFNDLSPKARTRYQKMSTSPTPSGSADWLPDFLSGFSAWWPLCWCLAWKSWKWFACSWGTASDTPRAFTDFLSLFWARIGKNKKGNWVVGKEVASNVMKFERFLLSIDDLIIETFARIYGTNIGIVRPDVVCSNPAKNHPKAP